MSAEIVTIEAAPQELNCNDILSLKIVADELRLSALQTIDTVSNGHIGASSSSAELMTVLYFGGHLSIDREDPDNTDRDRVIIRGHLGPLRYSLFAKLGWIDQEELQHYRTIDGLDGHENMNTPGVDIAPNGSLGMGLSYGVGCALDAKARGKNYKSVVFLGDGEMQEGNITEAAQQAATLGLDNLVVIVDRNGGQLSCHTDQVDPHFNFTDYWNAMGWDVEVIEDGHDIQEIHNVYLAMSHERERPLAIIANTVKGKDLPQTEDSICGYHTLSTCPREKLHEGIRIVSQRLEENMQNLQDRTVNMRNVQTQEEREMFYPPINIEITEDVLEDAGKTLVEYLKQLNEYAVETGRPVYFLTADYWQNDFAEECGFNLENRDSTKGSIFVNCGLREQHMMSMAYGIAASDPNAIVLTATGDQFLYRYVDQINAAAQGFANQKAPNGFGSIVIMSQFAGLSSTRNGYTHTSSGQPGAIMSMPGINMREIMDPEDWVLSMNEAIEAHDITLVRRHGAAVDPLYTNHFEKGDKGYYPLINSENPDVVVVGAGFPVLNAFEAAQKLVSEGINVNVINVVNPKSVNDTQLLSLLAKDVPVVIVYNGNPEPLAGLIAQNLLKNQLGSSVKGISTIGFDFAMTGRNREVMERLGLDTDSIARHITKIIKD
ncbi:MAG: 1-deoxy-D-xylulose-5-phosphate synthase N-terminal domain-containing protein [Candidatus Dojkabacteria bacterium]|jgi:transketolase|nr:hypothetical protein [Candidatus Dojkabacteria bacterium]